MKKQLSVAAFERVQTMIVSGELEPGLPLSELRLGDELGMSRSPIRTALEQLVAAGLVSHVPGKGYFVSIISVAHVTSVMEVREALESFATGHGHFADRLDVLRRLRLVFEHFAQMSDQPDEQEWSLLAEADQRFHAEIVASLNNPVAVEILDRLSLSLRQVRRIAWSRPDRFRTGAQEHVAIIDALTAADQDEASQLMGEHVSNAKALLVDLMSRRTQPTVLPVASGGPLLGAWLDSDMPGVTEFLRFSEASAV